MVVFSIGSLSLIRQKKGPPAAMSAAIVRPLLLVLGLVLAAGLVALHGVRALAILAAVLLLMSLARSPYWQRVEEPLVRLTGSRRRALSLVGIVAVVGLLAVSLYQLVS
jgi:hypothetical protein